jgi:PAS domain S-box-containing protein
MPTSVSDENTISALYRAIGEATSDAIIYADREGLVRLWNRGAELLFGHSASETLGRSLDIIIPERLRAAHWAAFDHSMRTGETKYRDRVLTTRSVHKNGQRIYVDLSFGLVRDASGGVQGAFAIGRDCTARYVAEREANAKMQALEAQLRGRA